MFGSSENQTRRTKGTEPGGVSDRLPFFRSLGRFFAPVVPTTPAHRRGSFSEIAMSDCFLLLLFTHRQADI